MDIKELELLVSCGYPSLVNILSFELNFALHLNHKFTMKQKVRAPLAAGTPLQNFCN